MTKCEHCQKWCGGTEDWDYFDTPDACWKYYTANRWHILCFRCYRRLVDWKDGGSIELACMSEVEKAAFFDYARDCGMWDWTKAEECHCDRACIGELSGTRRLGGVHRRHAERDGDRKSFVRQGLESVTGTEESVS